jgi:hypothetical protein
MDFLRRLAGSVTSRARDRTVRAITREDQNMQSVLRIAFYIVDIFVSLVGPSLVIAASGAWGPEARRGWGGGWGKGGRGGERAGMLCYVIYVFFAYILPFLTTPYSPFVCSGCGKGMVGGGGAGWGREQRGRGREVDGVQWWSQAFIGVSLLALIFYNYFSAVLTAPVCLEWLGVEEKWDVKQDAKQST